MIYNSQWQDVGSCVTTDNSTWQDLMEVPPEVLAYPGAVFIGSLRILAYIDDGVGAPNQATQLTDAFTISTSYSGGIADLFVATTMEQHVAASPTPLFVFPNNPDLQIVAAGSTAVIQVKGIAATTIRWAAIADVIGDNHP